MIVCAVQLVMTHEFRGNPTDRMAASYDVLMNILVSTMNHSLHALLCTEHHQFNIDNPLAKSKHNSQ